MPEQFVAIAERIVDALLEADPSTASSAGDHRFDGRLPDLSADAVARDVAMLRDPASRAIYAALRAHGPDATLDELTRDLSPDEVALVQEMQQKGTMGASPTVAVEQCIAKLQERDLKEQRREIDKKMRYATDAEKTELTKEKMRKRR